MVAYTNENPLVKPYYFPFGTQESEVRILSPRPTDFCCGVLKTVAKFLLFVVVLAVIYALVRASNRRGRPPPAARMPEPMTQCAHCGVHFPRAESISESGQDYCCDAHRRLGVRP